MDGLRRWTALHGTPARLLGDAALVAPLVGLVLLLAWVGRVDYVTREAVWPLWHVIEGILWAAVLLALLLLPGFLKPLLANRVWAFVGLVSYSLYLVHVPVIHHGRKLLLRVWPTMFPWLPGAQLWTAAGLVGAVVIVATALALASLTYVAIERPMLRLKSRIPT